jgi:predicted nucleotidyltransferase
LIRKAVNSLIATDSYLILQYGSSLFGSETKDSDYDIIVVCTLKTLSEATKMSETSRIRDSFLFGDLMAKIGLE